MPAKGVLHSVFGKSTTEWSMSMSSCNVIFFLPQIRFKITKPLLSALLTTSKSMYRERHTRDQEADWWSSSSGWALGSLWDWAAQVSMANGIMLKRKVRFWNATTKRSEDGSWFLMKLSVIISSLMSDKLIYDAKGMFRDERLNRFIIHLILHFHTVSNGQPFTKNSPVVTVWQPLLPLHH